MAEEMKGRRVRNRPLKTGFTHDQPHCAARLQRPLQLREQLDEMRHIVEQASQATCGIDDAQIASTDSRIHLAQRGDLRYT